MRIRITRRAILHFCRNIFQSRCVFGANGKYEHCCTGADASDKVYPRQLSGTVVDASGAVIAGATVEIRNADGTFERTTQSDRSGSFVVSGLRAGDYRLSYPIPALKSKKYPSPYEPPRLLACCVSLWLWAS
jgi:protocatechuate 3,4-dioxygenase beta subunit